MGAPLARSLVLAAFLVAAVRAAEPAPAPIGWERLAKAHPRLLATRARIDEIRDAVARDPLARKAADAVIAGADERRAQPPVALAAQEREPSLGLAGDLLERVQRLGVAWFLTGRDEFAQAAQANVLAACAFPTWHVDEPATATSLASAEIACAVALGYDWLYARWTPDERATIRAALARRAFQPALKDYAAHAWWTRASINWNLVLNGGLAMAALAVGDEEPSAKPVFAEAIAGLPFALATWDPSGVWPEGPGYWAYASLYTCFALGSLETALGSCLGLDQHDGLRDAGRYIVLTDSPTGVQAGFGDNDGECRLRDDAQLFWLARHYRRGEYADAELQNLRRWPGQASALDLVWWPTTTSASRSWPLDARFGGRCELACFRSGWDDDALYAWIKAGVNDTNHGHLDIGEFELYALGQRWSRDLGAEDYGVPGYFENGPGGRRWSYFRVGTQSHSLPLVDGIGQSLAASGRLIAFRDDRVNPYAIVDYGEAYRPAIASAARGLMLVGRRAALVQDELVCAKPCAITWAMTTDARIDADGARAALALGGKRLLATILSPSSASFTVGSAERPPPEQPNAGVRRLQVEVPHASGRVRIAVLLAPAWSTGPAPAPTVRPLAEWASRAGKRPKDDPLDAGPPASDAPADAPRPAPTPDR